MITSETLYIAGQGRNYDDAEDIVDEDIVDLLSIKRFRLPQRSLQLEFRPKFPRGPALKTVGLNLF